MRVLLLRGAASVVCAAISILPLGYVVVTSLAAPWSPEELILFMWVAMLGASGFVAFQFFYIAFLKVSEYRQDVLTR
jgi:hypothetical protein